MATLEDVAQTAAELPEVTKERFGDAAPWSACAPAHLTDGFLTK